MWFDSVRVCLHPSLISQLFFVLAKEEEPLRDEFALDRGERIAYQESETKMTLYVFCATMFNLIILIKKYYNV
jgi:hypothetical protein